MYQLVMHEKVGGEIYFLKFNFQESTEKRNAMYGHLRKREIRS